MKNYFSFTIAVLAIQNNLDNRENRIKDDLDDANKFKDLSESKLKEYEKILEDAKKEVIKIVKRFDDFTKDMDNNDFYTSVKSLYLQDKQQKRKKILFHR